MQENQSFKDLTLMISDVIDQVGVDDTQHGKRVGYMAWKCSEYLNIPEFEPTDILVAGLIHDIGVSSTQDHELLVTLLDWERANLHCIEGVKRLNNLPFYAQYIEAVQYHHTHWDELKKLPISDSSKQVASLIFMIDRVDALLFQYLADNPHDEPVHARESIHASLLEMDGFFNPVMIDAFMQASMIDAFWFNLEPNHLTRYLHAIDIPKQIVLDIPALEAVALILAAAVDAKSPYTADHSLHVGALAAYIGQHFDLNPKRCQQLKIAGYLHDIGKLHIPDRILDKQGPLDAKEVMAMHRHGFEARDILEQVVPFQEIAQWACQHHEYLDGSGYPYHLKAADLPIESRILTVADIFQALAQNRPYRASMPADKIVTILLGLVEEGKIDPEVVHFIEQNQRLCWQIATQ